MMKHLPRTFLFTLTILAASLFGATKEVNAQIEGISCNFLPTDSVVAVYNDANKIFILPGAYGNRVLGSLFFNDDPGTTLSLFMPDGVTPLSPDIPVPNGAKVRAERMIAVRATITREWTLFYRANLVSESYKLAVNLGQTYPGSINGFVKGTTVKEILDTLVLTNIAGQIKIYKDYSKTVEALPADQIGYNFVLEVTTSDLISREDYPLYPLSEFYTPIDVVPTCAGGVNDNVMVNYMGQYAFGAKFNWYVNGNLISKADTSIKLHLPGGNYNFELKVLNNLGNFVANQNRNVSVPGSTERFEMSSGAEACPGVPISFNYNGSSQMMEWDYGAGTFVQSNNDNNKPFEAGSYSIRLRVDPGSNCPVDTIVRLLTVKSGAIPYSFADFSAPQACIGDKIGFGASGGWSNDYTYTWDVNGEASFTNQRFNYAFSSLGTKKVILTTSNSCGGILKDTVIVELGANVPANADFNYNQVGLGCNTKTFQFNAQGAGSYIWNLGNGITSVLARPVAELTYDQEVKLMVTNGCGNSATTSKYVSYYNAGSGSGGVSFYINDSKNDSIVVAPGERVGFINSSNMPESVSYIWTFGDGATYEGKSRDVFHTYSDTITVRTSYEVKLDLNRQCSTSVATTKRVIVDPKEKLMAVLTALPTRICAGDKVYFFDDSRSDANYTYSIDFGDGNSVNGISNLELPAIEVLRTHKYATAGTYTYTFTAHAGLISNTVQGTITVTNDAGRIPFYYIENSTYRGPRQFFAEGMGIDSTHFIAFSDIRETSGDYDLGYHYSATDQIRRYSQGRFIRKGGQLILIEGNGPCGKDATYGLTVYGATDSLKLAAGTDLCASRLAFLNGKILRHVADESSASDIARKYACPTDTVRFLVAGSSTQAWHFTGNSTIQSTLAQAYYQYPTEGNFLAYAVVGNACGRIDTLYTKVKVSKANLPDPYFEMDVVSPVAGDAIRFIYKGIDDEKAPINAKLLWMFGDGTTSTVLSPVHVFDQVGTYTVRLQVTNGCGTRVSQNDVIVVGSTSNSPTASIQDGSSNIGYKVAGVTYRLDGSASKNASGGIKNLLFTWFPPASVSMSNATTAIPSYVLPADPISKKYLFKLKVTDLSTQKSAWDFIELVSAPNLIANAGNDFEALEGSSVTLNGSASVGITTSISWEDASSKINILNPNALVTTAGLPNVTKDSVATFILRLYSSGYESRDTLRIKIKNQYAEYFVDPVSGNDGFTGLSTGAAFKTINRAISAISFDGIINLMPGTYTGVGNNKFDLLGKDIYFKSTSGAASTIVEGSGTDTLFVSVGGSSFSSIEALTIKNFALVADISSEANLKLLNNRFSNCTVVAKGGSSDGVTTLVAKRNVFNECLNPFYNVSSDSLLITFNSFYLSTNQSGAVISFCSNIYAEVTNNILVGYSQGYDVSYSSAAVVTYNDIFNTMNPVIGGTQVFGQMALSPKYVDPVNLNFTLLPTSPCIDAGSPEVRYNDVDGSRADMGAIPSFRSAVTQNISMLRGWNIFSSNVLPVKPNMLEVLKPFVSSNQLIKAMDQSGNVVENSYGYWDNYIGAIDYTRGYLAKFDSDVTLPITGAPIVKDFDIPVTSGWNIIGMPLSSPKNVVDVVQHIQQHDNYLKVQSQTGAAFEYLPGYGWVNSIGKLMPGQGYRVQVEANEVIMFSAQASRSSDNFRTVKAQRANYFSPIWSGNGLNHMNVYVNIGAGLNLQRGDEVAVFSNGRCLGAASVYDASILLPILISQDDPASEEIDGFKDGDMLSFKVYRQHENSTTEDFVTSSAGIDLAAKQGGRLVITLSPNGTTGNDIVTTIENAFGVYPNPSEGEVNIEFSNAEDGNVTVEVFNVVGKRVAVVVNKVYQPGQHTVAWTGSTIMGDRVAPGIYLVRYTIGTTTISKRIVMK